MTRVKLGDKNIPFIYQGDELLYPNPVKDGLVLWYDFKGMKNNDVSKGIVKDLSDRKNDNAQLENFAYTSKSGYTNNGLKFDGVDDRITPMFTGGRLGRLDMKKINNGLKFSVEISLKMSDKILTQGSEIFMTNKTYGRFWLQFVKDFTISSSEEFNIVTSTYYGSEGGATNAVSSFKEGYKYGDNFHIIVTLDKEDKLKIFVNGEQKGEKPLNNIIITTPQEEDLTVFLGQSSSTAYYRRFDHELYSMKVYDRILTDQEIQHNYKLEKERWGL